MQLSSLPQAFVAGTLAVLASWVLTGCRLGNAIEGAPETDPWTGFYEAAPQTLQFCSVNRQTHETDCGAAATTEIPALLANHVPRLMIFQLLKSSTQGAFYSPYVSNPKDYVLYSTLGEAGRLTLEKGFEPSEFWRDPQCLAQLDMSGEGMLSKTSSNVISGVKTKGRYRGTVSVIWMFGSACGPEFEALRSCYLDAAQCGGASPADNTSIQESIRAFFLPYVNANVLGTTDWSWIQNLAYEVSYD
jgi:hypothetical protein